MLALPKLRQGATFEVFIAAKELFKIKIIPHIRTALQGYAGVEHRKEFGKHYIPYDQAHIDKYINRMVLPNKIRIPVEFNAPVGKYYDHSQQPVRKFQVCKLVRVSDLYPILREPKDITKPAAVAIGPIIRSFPHIVNYRSNNNWLRGVVKRVAHTFTNKNRTMKKFERFVKVWLKQNLTPLKYFEMSHELLDKEWLTDAKHYTLKQKNMYHNLLDKYLQLPVRDYKALGYENIYACNSFIKKEFYGELKEPRIINARSDLFKTLVAPYIKMIEHATIYNQHFIKGRTPLERVQRMKEIAERFKFVCESDYSSFEGSFSIQFQRICEKQLFDYMLSNNQEVKEIVDEVYEKRVDEQEIKRKLYKKFGTDDIRDCIDDDDAQAFALYESRLRQRYEEPPRNIMISANSRKWHDRCLCEGSRMSGDMWTSLANGFSNMMIFLFTMRRTISKSRQAHPVEYDFIVEGDDGFFAANIPFIAEFEQVVKELGFNIKIVRGIDINDLQFCSTCLGPNTTPVPDFWRLLEKFGWSFDSVIIDNYDEKQTAYERKMLYAKALSLNAESQGIPILQPLSIKIIELTGRFTLKQRIFDYWDTEVLKLDEWTPSSQPITDEMRVFFANRFGIRVDDQIKLEEFINKQTTCRFVIPIDRNHPDAVLEGL